MTSRTQKTRQRGRQTRATHKKQQQKLWELSSNCSRQTRIVITSHILTSPLNERWFIYWLVDGGSTKTETKRSDAALPVLSLHLPLLYWFVSLASAVLGCQPYCRTCFDVCLRVCQRTDDMTCASWNTHTHTSLIDSLTSSLVWLFGLFSACLLPLVACLPVCMCVFGRRRSLSNSQQCLLDVHCLCQCWWRLCLCALLDNIIIRCWLLSLPFSFWCHLALYFVAVDFCADHCHRPTLCKPIDRERAKSKKNELEWSANIIRE